MNLEKSPTINESITLTKGIATGSLPRFFTVSPIDLQPPPSVPIPPPLDANQTFSPQVDKIPSKLS